METINLSWEKLADILDDFREWYEWTWLNEDTELSGTENIDAISYYIRMKRTDPCWPDRTMEPV